MASDTGGSGAGWTIIYNPAAGRFSGDKLDGVRRVLEEAGIRCRAVPTKAPGHGTEIARGIRDAERVVAFGGDGTLREVAEGMLGREIPLAYLPGGSGNSMAAEIGLPKSPVAAAGALLRATPRPVRPGRVNGRHFLLNAGFGFDGLAVHLISKGMKNNLGPLGYILTGFRCLVHAHPVMEVETPRGTVRRRWVIAARGRYYAGILKVHPTAGLSRRDLGLAAANGWMLLPYGIGRLLLRLPVRGPGLSLEEHPAFRITAQVPVHYHVDGDPCGTDTAFEVNIAAEELRFCLPDP